MRVRFYNREAANNKQSIYIDIANNNDRIRLNTKVQVELNHWHNTIKSNGKKDGGRLSKEGIRKNEGLYEYFRDLKAEIEDAILSGVFNKVAFEAIIDKTKQNDSTDPEPELLTVIDAVEHWAKINKPKKSFSYWRKHKVLLGKLKDKNTMIENVNSKWLDQFVTGLNNEGLKNSTTRKYYSILKLALENVGLNIKHDVSHLSTNSTTIFLTEEELKDFAAVECSPSKQIVKDMFLFECYTGQRHSDIKKLSMADISKTTSGYVWSFTQTKTKKKQVLPLNKQAVAIIQKYEGLGKLPTISNQKMNKYLKEIGANCESLQYVIRKSSYVGTDELLIEKPKYEFLSTHVGRHTHACISLMRGMRYEMVAEVLGVDIQTVKTYVEITNDMKAKAISSVWDGF